jgi:ATP-dependent Zn protease
MSLSGGAAERMICGTSGGDGKDRKMALGYLTEEDIECLFDRAYREAALLVEEERPKIEIIARALVKRGTITGAQIAALLRSSRLGITHGRSS